MKDRIDAIMMEIIGQSVDTNEIMLGVGKIRKILEKHLQRQEKDQAPEVEISKKPSYEDLDTRIYKCTCGCDIYSEPRETNLYQYCPGCGAKIKRIDERQEKDQAPSVTESKAKIYDEIMELVKDAKYCMGCGGKKSLMEMGYFLCDSCKIEKDQAPVADKEEIMDAISCLLKGAITPYQMYLYIENLFTTQYQPPSTGKATKEKIEKLKQQEKEQAPDLTGLQGGSENPHHRWIGEELKEQAPEEIFGIPNNYGHPNIPTGKATKEKIEKLDINMQNGLDWRDEIETKINEIILYLNQHT